MSFQWYALNTTSGREEKAKKDLENAINKANINDYVKEILIPREVEVSYNSKNERKEKIKTIMPGYILINMNVIKAGPVVFSTRAIFSPAQGTADNPVPMTTEEIQRFLEKDTSGSTTKKIMPTSSFQEGEKVRITSGPFANFIGEICQNHNDGRTVKVTLEIFGRPTDTEVPISHIVKEN